MDEEEIWKPVVGFPAYEISSLARIRRVETGRAIRPLLNGSGYHYANLYTGPPGRLPKGERKMRAKLLHRLHYEAFTGPIPDGYTIDHLDFDPIGNRLDNYRVCTVSENAARSHAAGRHPKGPGTKPGSGYFGAKKYEHIARGERAGPSKLKDADIVEIRRRRAELGESFGTIAKRFGVSQPMIGLICRRVQWAHVPDPDGVDWSPANWVKQQRAKETRPRNRDYRAARSGAIRP